MTRLMKDYKLRLFSLWVAGFAGLFSVAGFSVPQVRPLIIPGTLFVSGLVALLFIRMLFSRYYRRGTDLVNLAMRGEDPWPGKPKKLSDPEWGLFGDRCGTLPLLWVRAVLMLGMLPAYFVQHWTGVQAGWLWIAATFLILELSMMHAIIEEQERSG